jgi:hypothetical protein
MASESVTSLSSSAVLAEDSLSAVSRSGLHSHPSGLHGREDSLPAPPRFGAASSTSAVRKPPPPPKDDEYEDF